MKKYNFYIFIAWALVPILLGISFLMWGAMTGDIHAIFAIIYYLTIATTYIYLHFQSHLSCKCCI